MDETLNEQQLELIFIAATDGGVIGFDVSNGEWTRVVSENGGCPEGFDGFSCLDVLLLKRGKRPEQPCRGEDIYFVGGDEPCVIGRKGLTGLAKLRSSTPDGKIFGGAARSVGLADLDKIRCGFALIYVTDFVVDVKATLEATENRCAFNYNTVGYNGFPLADPALCGAENDGAGCVHAYVAVGLVPDAEKEGRFIKTALKVIPLPPEYSVNNAYGEGAGRVINFYKEGYFYSVFDDDAVLLNTLFGYKLIAGRRARTGIPVAGARKVAAQLDGHGIIPVFRDGNGRETELSQTRKQAAKPRLVPEGIKVDENGMLIDGDGVVRSAKELEKEVKNKCVEMKEFLDAVLAGVNPVTERAIPGDDFTRTPEMIECLNFVSEILVKVSGRKGRKRKAPKCLFYLSDEAYSAYIPYETPVSLSLIINRINEISDGGKVQKLKFADVFNALIERGYMREEQDGEGKPVRIPTQAGLDKGILYEKRLSQHNVEYMVTLYGEKGQRFILDLVKEICI